MPMQVPASGGQSASGLLDPELQEVVSHLWWDLGTELSSSARFTNFTGNYFLSISISHECVKKGTQEERSPVSQAVKYDQLSGCPLPLALSQAIYNIS